MVINNGRIADESIVAVARFIMAPHIAVANVAFAHKAPVIGRDIIPPVETYRNIYTGR